MRGLYWEEPRICDTWSANEDDTCAHAVNLCTALTGGRMTFDVIFKVQQAYMHEGCLVESGFEPETFQFRSRNLKLRPLQLWQLDYSNPQKGKSGTVIPTPAGIHPQIPFDPSPERV
ncbi:hypothetical protein AVEN_59661-1 [Araneus ventricosus]|uniref:Uncharacterized protein n=1 Tax=Araneus ventricosus TaxID=182803 RepID=A0A4Y2BPV1_ARAVE|nr:hypothetical protein AVEN_59661-1 [Araneus ventricosus]